MEVSNEIKEDIRKTQTDLKNAIRWHQVWVARLQDDENNSHFKTKVKEAEREIIAIGHAQKLVVDRLRRELELYQQRLKSRNKQVNIENDNRYVAQQLRDHQIQFRSKNRSVSLLKPSVLNEIHIKVENNNEDIKENNISDSENEIKSPNEKENSNHSEGDDKDKYHRIMSSAVHDDRNNFTNALSKVKECLIYNGNASKLQCTREWQQGEQRSESDSSVPAESPSPSPSPPLPESGQPFQQETFLRVLGLVTRAQREVLERKRNERRKRSTTSTNKNDFLYGNFDISKRKKYNNQFSYLQSHNDPPQTRSAKLRKQQNHKTSREGSPSGSSTENKSELKCEKGTSTNKLSWTSMLPSGLTVEPVAMSPKVCHGCGRNDVVSLLVQCVSCSVWQHTGCGAGGRCAAPHCRAALPDPAHRPPAPHPAPTSQHPAAASPHGADPPPTSNDNANNTHVYRDKLSERKRLHERNIQLCIELRKLEVRAASLKENLDEHNEEKRQLLADQIKTQRNLQKLLDFISNFKETSISIHSTSVSESGTDSKSNEE